MDNHLQKPSSKFKIALHGILYLISFLVVTLYICTYFAGLFYVFELLGNFLLQIMLAALMLAIFAALLKDRLAFILMLSLTMICFIQSRLPMETPWRFTPPNEASSLTIASYNQQVLNEQFNDMAAWLNAPENNFDVVILIEATPKSKRLANRVKKTYPHQLYKHTALPRRRPMSYFIFSKHEILNHENIQLAKKPFHNWVGKFQIRPDGAQEPYTIFAAHTNSPVTPENLEFRNQELEKFAQIIAQDNAKKIIAIGDFNNTPYSRHFQKFKQISGLNFQSYGLFLNPTWPSRFNMPFMRIPIDHVFYSDTLIQQNKIVGPSMGSDHHALIARFSEKP